MVTGDSNACPGTGAPLSSIGRQSVEIAKGQNAPRLRSNAAWIFGGSSFRSRFWPLILVWPRLLGLHESGAFSLEWRLHSGI